MIEGLETAQRRYEELGILITKAEVIEDRDRYKALMKEYRDLEPLSQRYETLLKAERNLADAKDIVYNSGDKDLKELAEAEVLENEELIEKVEEEVRIMLLPKDPRDERSVIVEIRAGTGGEEAALFAAELYRMYSMYAPTKGWTIEEMNLNETELGGIKEIVFSMEGERVYSRMKFESGTHRVQRVPVTESNGKIQTSAVTVAVLPEVDDVEVELNPEDLKIDTFRSSGAGGQKVNKTSSAIRVTYLPTGLVVECQDERSQYKNKDRALKILKSRLFEQAQAAQSESIAADRRQQVGSGDRSERIRTYNFTQGRVSDHRINLTIYQLESVLNGNLDLVLDPLLADEQARKLEGK